MMQMVESDAIDVVTMALEQTRSPRFCSRRVERPAGPSVGAVAVAWGWHIADEQQKRAPDRLDWHYASYKAVGRRKEEKAVAASPFGPGCVTVVARNPGPANKHGLSNKCITLDKASKLASALTGSATRKRVAATKGWLP